MNKIIKKEYLGNTINFKMIDGHVYADANKMAEGFGGSQKLADWKRSDSTKKYITALEKALWKNSITELIIVKQGGKADEQGTWIHEKLILNFARYLNVEFELWCDEQIATLLREGKVEIKKSISDESKKKRLEIMEKNANVRMSKQFTKLAELTKDLRYKEVLISLGTNVMTKEDVLPLPRLEQKSYTAEEIGKIIGISSNMVGRIANKYNLKNERYGYLVQNKAKHCNKSIESFRYYEPVIDEFKKILNSDKPQ